MRVITSVLVAAAALTSTVMGDRHRQELKEHYDHLAYIAEYNCHLPQPRVLSVHELFSESETAHKAFFPDVTVLHRCDSYAGCCPSNHFCRPKHTHSLNLPFKVTFLEHMGKHKKGSWIIDYHKFDNHTECECVDASVCVPEHIETSHEPEHQGESHHEPDHKVESHPEPEHTQHQPESHKEPDHNEHLTESHHEPDHQPESHHEPDHQPESHHEPDHKGTHQEPSHVEQSESSYEPDNQNFVSSSPSSADQYSSSSPDFAEQETESSTVPLLVNYVLSSSQPPATDKPEEQNLSSFFD